MRLHVVPLRLFRGGGVLLSGEVRFVLAGSGFVSGEGFCFAGGGTFWEKWWHESATVSLDQEVVACDSVNGFKAKLDKFLVGRGFV